MLNVLFFETYFKGWILKVTLFFSFKAMIGINTLLVVQMIVNRIIIASVRIKKFKDYISILFDT